jgi:tetratricopeptide (TPR) repeat protein
MSKAVDYLVKAGEKSLARYSVEEAHQYYMEAYRIMASKEDKTEEERYLFIDMLNSWAYVYYYLGDMKEFIALLNSHKQLADSLNDRGRRGMFYVWLGIALWLAGRSKDSREYLRIGLELGENSGNQKVVGYACTWLSWACGELGALDDGIRYGERAQKIAESFPSDQYLFFKSLAGLTYCNFFKGNVKATFEAGQRLLDYGERTSNSRSKVFGHYLASWGYMMTGDIESTIKSCEKAVQAALDPFYSMFPIITLAMSYVSIGQFQKAEEVLRNCSDSVEKCGLGQLLVLANLITGPILIAKGQLTQGLRIIEEAQNTLLENHRRGWYTYSEIVHGMVYAQMATGPLPALGILVKNIGILARSIPFGAKEAEDHFNKAINLSREIGTKAFLGLAYLNLGLLHLARKKTDQARESLKQAAKICQECDAYTYLKQAKEALDNMG